MFKFFLLFIGILTVLSQVMADCAQDVLEAKPHNIDNVCRGEENWALLPYPYDCHKFIVCANYVPEEFKCERNYYFDTEEKRCVRGSCDAVEQCQNWVRGVDDDCTAFEVCEDGIYVRYKCTDNHYFNAEIGMCLKIEHTPQHMCSCILPQYSLMENTKKCDSFYTCVNRFALLQQCPKGAYFDKRLNTCIVDLFGICVTPPTMTTEENAMLDTCQRLSMGTDDEIIFVADTEQCDKFYMCLNGRVVAKECPAGFYFNRETKYCEYDSFGMCEAIKEQTEKKEQQEEKEAAEKDKENHKENEVIAENPPKPPVHVSLSYTHLKVEAEKGNVLEPTQHKETESSVEIMHTDDLEHIPIPPIRLGQTSKKANAEPAPIAKQEPVESNVQNSQNLIKKQPQILHAELKIPGNSAYDKLSSKFMVF